MSTPFNLRSHPVPLLVAASTLLIVGLMNSASSLAASIDPGNEFSVESEAWRSTDDNAPGVRRLLGNSVDVPLGKNSSPEVAANLNQLRRQAAASDKIRVIVGVRAAFAPEGFQDQSTRQRQRQEIGAVQSTIEKALPRRDEA